MTPDRRDFFVEHGGRRIAVRDYGGDGPALLLLHGGGGNVAGWETLAPFLVPELTVIAHDAAGHGASDWAEPFREALLDEIDVICERFSIEAPFLVGSSMGALTAHRYAARGRRCAGIVAIDGAMPLTAAETERPPQPFEEFAEQARADGWGFRGDEGEADAWVAETAAGKPPPAEAHLRRSLQPAGDGVLEQRPTIEHAYTTRISAYELPAAERAVEIYERIACPVLLLNASQGVTTSYTDEQRARLDALPQRFPHVTSEWVDAGHLIHWDEPRVVANRIREFVRDARGAS